MEEVPEVSVTMTLDDLASSISERTLLQKEEVTKIVNAFIEHYLVKFKLK